MNLPIAFLLTWTTYGSRLHGDPRGTFSKGIGYVKPDEHVRLAAEALMTDDAVYLTQHQREIVDAVIVEHCQLRGWQLHARNVRTNHVHVVVSANVEGEFAREQFKAWASHRLSEDAGLAAAGHKNGSRRWWTEKGDVNEIWNDRHLAEASVYVDERQ